MTVMVDSHSHSHAGHAGHGHHGHHHQAQHYSSYAPSDFDLLRALTSSSGLSNLANAVPQPTRLGAVTGAKKAVNTRRPQMDPLILETAALSGPHVTRNHFLHEFYPHPEDPSSSFSHHLPYGHKGQGGYASCDIGPEDDVQPQQKPARYTPARAGPSAVTAASSQSNAFFPIAAADVQQRRHPEASTSAAAAKYESRQAPRRVRLEREKAEEEELLQKQKQGQDQEDQDSALSTSPQASLHPSLREVDAKVKLQDSVSPKSRKRSSVIHPDPIELPKILKQARSPALKPATQAVVRDGLASNAPASSAQTSTKPPLSVLCHGRTRVPTPHGEVFIHLYKNNYDDKEHLAFVFDRDQLNQPQQLPPSADDEAREDIVRGTLRSKSLDASWREGETDMERIVRGAYVGRLSSSTAVPSTPPPQTADSKRTTTEPVLIRVHSECFTGETIGSQRCDCGEQLDEAFRLISTSPSGLGIVVYLRQEGRGIGLLEKIKAYNLQDLGHDTVTANLLLGHSADMRTYGIAGEILRDLGVDRVQLLTNNPDKIDSVEKEGIKVVERVPMVPRGWNVPTLPGTRRKQKKTKERRPKASSSKRTSGASKAKRDKSTLAGRLGAQLEGISSIAQSSASEYEEEEEEGDSYEFPSVNGSDADGDGDGGADGTDSDESEEEEGEDTDTSGDAAADYLIAMNRTGVGMIGAGTTHSVELERYLKTKVERMGHLLAVPNTPPSTPEPLRRSKKKSKLAGGSGSSKLKQASSNPSAVDPSSPTAGEGKGSTSSSSSRPPLLPKERKKVGKSKMEDSVTSILHTDPESINCEDCSECGGDNHPSGPEDANGSTSSSRRGSRPEPGKELQDDGVVVV